MEYKGYTITSDIKTYQEWSMDEQGDPKDFLQYRELSLVDFSDIASYNVYPPDEDGEVEYFDTLDEAKRHIDSQIALKVLQEAA